MATYTKSYKLKKPNFEDYYDIRDINYNLDLIETALLELENRDTGSGENGATGKDGADGADGLSAYEIAVKNGFSGSEAEWRLSVQGSSEITMAVMETMM